jgi:hypothetical protein
VCGEVGKALRRYDTSVVEQTLVFGVTSRIDCGVRDAGLLGFG